MIGLRIPALYMQRSRAMRPRWSIFLASLERDEGKPLARIARAPAVLRGRPAAEAEHPGKGRADDAYFQAVSTEI